MVKIDLPPSLVAALRQVRVLALDFDGVMTDNRVFVDEQGGEAVWCHRGDGLGVANLQRNGFHVLVISTERNPVVRARCRKLNIPCYSDIRDKLTVLRGIASKEQWSRESIAFVGNDVNDLEVMQWVGVPICVADAMPTVIEAAAYVTQAQGGFGAVREVADLLLDSRE